MVLFPYFFVKRPVPISKKFLGSAYCFYTQNDLALFEKRENPYEFFSEEDKTNIPNVGTSLNSHIIDNNGKAVAQDMIRQHDMFSRLIKSKRLSHDIIVHRGIRAEDYFRMKSITKENGFSKQYLYSDIFVYGSLLETKLYSRKYHLIIKAPVGTNYLYTGIYSNTSGSNHDAINEDSIGEIIFDIGTVFKRENIRWFGKQIILELTIEQ